VPRQDVGNEKVLRESMFDQNGCTVQHMNDAKANTTRLCIVLLARSQMEKVIEEQVSNFLLRDAI